MMKSNRSLKLHLPVLAVVFLSLATCQTLAEESQPGPFDGQIKTTRHFDQAIAKLSVVGIVSSGNQKRVIIGNGEEGLKVYALYQTITVIVRKEPVKFRIVGIKTRQVSLKADNNTIYQLAV